ncbi:hypothetical protein MTO96_005543 [Rhipicephalus appendiculatus]|uniref:Uncharacterized protein n=1 Tax=Rhipicephalus appendiculatus TaxID=34631 RepID=A0A131YUT3_RHIAP
MRAIPIFTLLFVIAVATCVSATSEPNCESVNCSEVECEPTDCTCGSRKGSCDCCDVCYKCPGDVCIPLFQEICSSGYTCDLDSPIAYFFGGAGECKPSSSS